MSEFTIIEDDEPEPDLPGYGDVGAILFEIHHIYREADPQQAYEIEVLDYSGSTMWIQEGMGIDYYLNECACIDLDEVGFYVMEGVTGRYIRGDGWEIDDDEEWDFEYIRRASKEEIEGQCL